MKLIYEALNTLEAHMILNLLEQADLSARIDGEYLQGGVGELQAIGVVRVMIDEKDYDQGVAIIQEWEAKQPELESQSPAIQKKSGFRAGAIGFILGVTVMAIYYNTPITSSGIDYNGDGKLDETWTYVNKLISKSKIDRNLDGKIDFIYSFDRKGLLESSSSDENFDGVFDTDGYYDYGNAIWLKSDTTGDGFKDYRIDFKNGIVEKISFIDPATKKIIKTQEYGPFLLRRAKVDTTGDGVFDTLHDYDATEEIIKKN